MTKKWLWYVCIGLICCSSLAYVYAKQTTGTSNLRTERDVLVEKLAGIRAEMQAVGKTPELIAAHNALEQQLFPGRRSSIDNELINKLKDGAMKAEVEAAKESKAEAAAVAEPAPVVSGNLAASQQQDAQFAKELPSSPYVGEDLINVQTDNVALQSPEAVATLDQFDGVELTADQKAEIERADALRDEEENRDNSRNPLDATGGPDAAGYRWVDDAAPDTATYSWVEIGSVADGGTLLTTISGNSDGGTAAITPSFAFPFYGVNRTTLYVGIDGYVSMAANTDYTQLCTGIDTGEPSGAIYGFHDDLHTGAGGTGTFGTVSDSGSVWWKDEGSRIIVQWDSVGHYDSPRFDLTFTFQVILYPDGKIKVQWREITRYSGTQYPSARVGIQQGTAGTYLNYKCSTTADITFEDLDGHAVWFYNDAVGRCCYMSGGSGTCAESMTAVDCAALVGEWGGVNSTCASAPCSFGRCCYVDAGVGTCADNYTSAACTALSGQFGGVGTTCAANPCPIGRCCYGDACAPTCDDVMQVECTFLAGTWTSGSNCTANPCPTPLAGDLCCNAIPLTIGTVGGTTVGFTNNYDAVCPYTGSTSPDVVYSYTPAVDEALTVDLCASLYDTKIYIATGCPLTTLVDCNDDVCGNDTYKSRLSCVPLIGGTTYYIVVDGYGGASGTYTLTSTLCSTTMGRCCYQGGYCCAETLEEECTTLNGVWVAGETCANPCTIQCPLTCGPQDILEPAESDSVNSGHWDPTGGCNSDSSIFYSIPSSITIACDDTVCGRLFARAIGSRDTDWWTLVLTDPAGTDVTWSGISELPGMLLYIVSSPCATASVLASNTPTACGIVSSATITNLAPGTYYMWAGTDFPTELCPTVAMDAKYRAWVHCQQYVPPNGRCCYTAGGCADITEAACAGLGTWSAGLTCATDPCPVVVTGGETCADAQAITIGTQYTGTTVGHIDDDPALSCGGYPLGTAPDVFFTVVGNGDSLSVRLCGSAYDTGLLVFCGSCTAPVCVGGSDDDFTICGDADSRVDFRANNGTTYYIVVDGWSANSGVYSLEIIDLGPWSTGAPVDCDPMGRCCYLDAGVGTCGDMSASACGALGGTFLAGVTCATSPCPTGRCCYVDNGVAACDDVMQVECLALGGSWTSGSTCAASPCPTGRCCYTGGCVTTTTQVCTFLAGTWTSGMNCEFYACPATPANDECATAEVVVIPAWCSVSYNVNLEGATGSCDELTTGDGVIRAEYTSTGPDVFYSFTLSECRRIAIKASTPDASSTSYRDSHISVSTVCCNETNIILGNDDFGGNEALATTAWLPVDDRPLYSLGSMVVGELAAGTYYVRAGYYGSGTIGQYVLTFEDYGPCVAPNLCEPGDLITDLRVVRDSLNAQSAENYVKLHFHVTNPGLYHVWSSIYPGNDGDPDGPDADLMAEVLDDPQWVCETELMPLSLTTLDTTWSRPAGLGFESYINFVMTPICDPTPPTGRCCYVDAGNNACANTTEAGCTALSGIWTIYYSCECQPCPQEGRCCYLDINNQGACDDLIQDDCLALGGTWTAGANCTANPCELAACCYNDGANCADLQIEECAFLGGAWYQGYACLDITCPVPITADDCATPTPLTVVPNGYVIGTVDLTPATWSCDDLCDYDSQGPDLFASFTLTGNRKITIIADGDFSDSHISLYADGDCCGTALYCNDDFANFTTLPWHDPLQEPDYSLESLMEFELAAGTYIVRCGAFGTGIDAYALVIFDNGAW